MATLQLHILMAQIGNISWPVGPKYGMLIKLEPRVATHNSKNRVKGLGLRVWGLGFRVRATS